MAYFPIFIALHRALVVGGGTVATRKVQVLSAYCGELTVVAPEISQEIASLASQGGVRLERREFAPGDVQDMDIAIAATDDPDCNRAVAAACRARHIPVNVADVPELCDFYFPALVRRGDLVIGIGTGGKSPAFARNVRKKLEALLPERLGDKLSRAGKLREIMLLHGKTPAASSEYNEAVTIE